MLGDSIWTGARRNTFTFKANWCRSSPERPACNGRQLALPEGRSFPPQKWLQLRSRRIPRPEESRFSDGVRPPGDRVPLAESASQKTLRDCIRSVSSRSLPMCRLRRTHSLKSCFMNNLRPTDHALADGTDENAITTHWSVYTLFSCQGKKPGNAAICLKIQELRLRRVRLFAPRRSRSRPVAGQSER